MLPICDKTAVRPTKDLRAILTLSQAASPHIVHESIVSSHSRYKYGADLLRLLPFAANHLAASGAP